MEFLKLEDVIDAFEKINLLDRVFHVEKIKKSFLVDIENFNKTLRNNPYRMQGLQNFVDSINFFIEKDYCLNIPNKWNIEDETGKWGSLRDYIRNNTGLHIEIYPEYAIDDDVLGEKFNKSNFSSKDFARYIANQSIYPQNIGFETRHENYKVYDDKKEKFLIIEDMKEKIIKKNEIFKNISWKDMLDRLDKDISSIENDELKKIIKNHNIIPGKSLLCNYGNNHLIKNLDIFYIKDDIEATRKKIEYFWMGHENNPLLEEIFKDPRSKDVLLDLIKVTLDNGIPKEFMLASNNIEVFKEVFKKISEISLMNLAEEEYNRKLDLKCLSFIKENNLSDVLDKKVNLFTKLVNIHNESPFDLELLEKLMNFGLTIQDSNNNSRLLIKLIKSLFFGEKIVDKNDIEDFLIPTYESSLNIKNKNDIVPYWMALYYKGMKVIGEEKGLDNESMIISSYLKINIETYRLIETFENNKSGYEFKHINLNVINQEIREIYLMQKLEEKENNILTNKRKI